MSNTDDELDKILDKLVKYISDVKDISPFETILEDREAVANAKQAIQAYTDKEVVKAERPFYEAFNNKGKTPSYHDRQVERLRREWRVLYNALSQLKGDK